MRKSEQALLKGVLARLLAAENNGGAGLKESECSIEIGDMAPAVNGDLFVAVAPGGWRPGPRHNTSGGVNDLLFSVRLFVAKRIGNVARDRYFNTLEALNTAIDKIFPTIDFNYTVLTAANALLADDPVAPSSEGFVEPLRLIGDVSAPQIVGAEYFGGRVETQNAGLMRMVPFGLARRITTKAA